jgi:hypothetical protein
MDSTSAQTDRLWTAALWLAVFTILYNIAEAWCPSILARKTKP